MTKLNSHLARLERLINHHQSKLESTMNQRLTVGLIIFTLMMASASLPNIGWLSLTVPVALVPFIVLFIKTRRLQRHLSTLRLWSKMLSRQIERKNGTFSQEFNWDCCKEFPLDILTRAKDLHLCGATSLFSQMDETITEGGQQTLLNWILNPNLDRQEVQIRQKQIEELGAIHWPLLKLKIQADSQEQKLATSSLKRDLDHTMVGEKFKMFGWGHIVLYPLAWTLTILGAYQVIPISPALPFTFYFLFFIISKGQILDSFQRTEGMSVHLDKLKSIFLFIEQNFRSDTLQNTLPEIVKQKPSQDLTSLSRYSAALSVMSHPLVYILVNILFPWDYLFTALAEKWRIRWSKLFPTLLDELHQFEALMSSALFHHYQAPHFPILSNGHEIYFTDISHPLISKENMVKNSWALPTDKNLILITGSNMSGKSTFLRTFGINHQLAQMGCPVYAEQMTTPLAPLYTCLQVADSLEAGYSTFYYEVKQISQMIEKAKNGETFIFLIDEIFRGTNNRERLIGSQTVIKELVKADNSLGLITTHDLELTQLESQFPSLTNWHFKDDVDNNQLTFSYKIQAGACPTTNALKIMANEGLPVPLNP